MRALEEKLKEVLESEIDLYKKILDIAERKTDILKRSEVDELEALTLEERDAVLEVGMIEERREKTIRGLASELGVSEKLDLSSMSKYFSEDGQDEFRKIRDQLNTIIGRIREANSLNETLIRDSLDYIDFSLNIMTSASADGSYGKNATEIDGEGTAPNRNLFDIKA